MNYEASPIIYIIFTDSWLLGLLCLQVQWLDFIVSLGTHIIKQYFDVKQTSLFRLCLATATFDTGGKAFTTVRICFALVAMPAVYAHVRTDVTDVVKPTTVLGGVALLSITLICILQEHPRFSPLQHELVQICVRT